MEEKKLDFEKIGRADLACRTAQRLAYHWQVRSPGWRLSIAPDAEYDTLIVTLHRMDTGVRSGTESIPVEELDWSLPDADIFTKIATVGNRLLGSWVESQERKKVHTPIQVQPRP